MAIFKLGESLVGQAPRIGNSDLGREYEAKVKEFQEIMGAPGGSAPGVSGGGIEGILAKAIEVISGIASPQRKANAHLERMEVNTKQAVDLQRIALGGGELGRMGVTPIELNHINGGGGGVSGGVQNIARAIHEAMQAAFRDGQMNAARAGLIGRG
ncbi:MAG: hypothetical protein M9921_13055 [Fimbriimonadaceae bacterium]|nr:hypothetical protein [Fimbriimonadaceae bacterium]